MSGLAKAKPLLFWAQLGRVEAGAELTWELHRLNEGDLRELRWPATLLFRGLG